jgi:hypothetical protein
MSVQKQVDTFLDKAYSHAGFRAFMRVVRVAGFIAAAKFAETAIPLLQGEPSLMGIPAVAILLIGVDKYLRDSKVY